MWSMDMPQSQIMFELEVHKNTVVLWSNFLREVYDEYNLESIPTTYNWMSRSTKRRTFTESTTGVNDIRTTGCLGLSKDGPKDAV